MMLVPRDHSMGTHVLRSSSVGTAGARVRASKAESGNGGAIGNTQKPTPDTGCTWEMGKRAGWGLGA